MSRRTAAWSSPRRTSATGCAGAAAAQSLRRAIMDLEDAAAALDGPVTSKRPEIAKLQNQIEDARYLLIALREVAEG